MVAFPWDNSISKVSVILWFSPWTNKVSVALLYLLILALPFPRTFVGALFPVITLPSLLFLRDSNLFFSPTMWWENSMSMCHSSSSLKEQRERPHLIYSSSFYLLWEMLGDPSFLDLLTSIFLYDCFPCCLWWSIDLFLHSFSTCPNFLQA